MYPDVKLHINGEWATAPAAAANRSSTRPPARCSARLAHAGRPTWTRRCDAADKGFEAWRKVSAYERYKMMRKAADLMRERADDDRRS